MAEDADSESMSNSDIESGYLNAQQAAEYLSVSERLIRREASAGRLAAFRPLRGIVRFHRDDLDNWMRRGRIETTQAAAGEQGYRMAPMQARRRSRPRTA